MLYMNGKQVLKYGALPTLRYKILGHDCCIMCLAEHNRKNHREGVLRRKVLGSLADNAENEIAFSNEILREALANVFEG